LGTAQPQEKVGKGMHEHPELTEARSDDPRVLAAAQALREHFAAEDSNVLEFPSDEYVCCAEVALKAAGVL
jgi:hypothetical protein